MPLGPEEFDAHRTGSGRVAPPPLDPELERMLRLVHAFLRDNQPLAYNESELRDALRPRTGIAALHEAAHELMHYGGVDARDYEGKTYYRYLDPIPEFE